MWKSMNGELLKEVSEQMFLDCIVTADCDSCPMNAQCKAISDIKHNCEMIALPDESYYDFYKKTPKITNDFYGIATMFTKMDKSLSYTCTNCTTCQHWQTCEDIDECALKIKELMDTGIDNFKHSYH